MVKMTYLEAIRNCFNENEKLSTSQVFKRIQKKYPGRHWKKNTVRSHLIGLSVNHSSRGHYSFHKKAFLRFSKESRNAYFQRNKGTREKHSMIMGKKDRRRMMTSVKAKIETLCKEIDGLCKISKDKYKGPSLYFHCESIRRLEELENSADRAVNDDRFCELLYATLTAWGMHKMTPSTQLQNFDTFKKNLRKQTENMKFLSGYRILELTSNNLGDTARKIWSLIDALDINTSSNARLVVGSKALHHLLPELVPPIDGKNTLPFFGKRANNRSKEEKCFIEIYKYMHDIACRCRKEIGRILSRTGDGMGMNTSVTKVIDNAILGYQMRQGLA